MRRKGQRPSPREAQAKPAIDNLIVIGASAGAHHALEEIFKRLSPDIPAALVILVHSSGPDRGTLGQWLARFTRIPIVTVKKAERLRPRTIFLAPAGRAVWLTDGLVNVEAGEHGRTYPVTTINRLFESAAKAYGRRVIGLILTGLLKDGTDGLRAVHEAGGLTVVQDPKEAEYGDMPASAMRDLPVTFCLSLSDIGPALDLLARRQRQLETGLDVSIRTMEERLALLVRFLEQSQHNAGTHAFLLQELTSLKHQLSQVKSLLPTGSTGKKPPRRRPEQKPTRPPPA